MICFRLRTAWLLCGALAVSEVARADPPAPSLDAAISHGSVELAGPQPDGPRSGPATLPPQAPLPAGAPPPDRRWYGWQTLATNGVAIGLVVGGLASTRSDSGGCRSCAGIGIIDGIVGAPIVHALHGFGGRSLGSLGLRLIPVVVAGGVLAAAYNNDRFATDLALTGVGATYVGAVVIDAAVLAYDDPPRPVDRSSWVIRPTASAAPGRSLSLGVNVAF